MPDRGKHVTFRTTEAASEEISALADRVKKNKFEFPWNSTMRDCTSRSGILHQVLSENITIPEIRAKVSAVEAEKEKQKTEV